MVPIQIENLQFTYPSRDNATLNGITTSVSPGDFILLTGPTGCGKTTLLRTINGLIPHASSGFLAGGVFVNGMNVADQPLHITCQQVSLLFQNPDDQLFCTSVEDEIAFALENLGYLPDEIRNRITTSLDQVSLNGFEERRIEELSGGEKQRVALASICAIQPKVLLLDEPTSQLDPRGTHDILNIVKILNTELGITVVLATHQVNEVAPLCNRVWFMNDGKLHLDMPKEEACGGDNSFKNLGELISAPLTQSNNVKRVPPINRTSFLPILKVEEIDFSYPNSEQCAVKSISYNVNRSEIIAIMGENGSGKTTLLKLMGGILKPSQGEVYIDGISSFGYKYHQLAGKIGIVFQNPDLILQAETVLDEVSFGPKNLNFKGSKLQSRINIIIDQFKIENLVDEAPYALSRGQRQRVAIASIYSLHPDLFLLDEPSTGQDSQNLQRLMDELCFQMREENKSLIFSTHNIELTRQYADRVILLCNGEMIYDGLPEVAFEDPELLKKASLVF